MRLYHECRWTELAALRHGLDARTVERLCRQVAVATVRTLRADRGRINDLHSRLCVVAYEELLRYDPQRPGRYGERGGDPVRSWLVDILQRRALDYWRSPSEGFSRSRRFGPALSVADFGGEEEAEVDLDAIVERASRARWRRAARALGESLEEYVVRALDERAQRVAA